MAVRAFFEAVRMDDLETVETLLSNGESGSELSRVTDECGRSALTVAIEYRHLKMVKLLLRLNSPLSDALLLAIEKEFVEAVKLICDHSVVPTNHSQAHDVTSPLNRFTVSLIFPVATTPLILAARRDHYSIIKLLIDNGARIPSLETVLSKTPPNHYDQALTRLQWYQATSSNAYITLTSDDPIETAMKLAETLQQLAGDLPQLNTEYDSLTDSLGRFVNALLEEAQSADEIVAILNKGSAGAKEPFFPKRMQKANNLAFKMFLANPHSQEYMLDKWYGSFRCWRRFSTLQFLAVSMLMIVLQPIISLLYIVIPSDSGVFIRFMKAPYMRYLMHTSSRMLFFLLLVYSTVGVIVPDNGMGDQLIKHQSHMSLEELRENYIAYRSPIPTVTTWFIIVWIIGMTWREMNEAWRQGGGSYVRNRWNWVDFLQLKLYWIYVALIFVSAMKAKQEVFSQSWLDRYDPQRNDSVNTSITMNDSWSWNIGNTLDNSNSQSSGDGPVPAGSIFGLSRQPGSLEEEPESANEHTEKNVSGRGFLQDLQPISNWVDDKVDAVPVEKVVQTRFLAESRLDWSAFDPQLVAEASFAIANMLTFLAFMHSLVIVSSIGPLQLSLGGMVEDITKFFCLFCFVWISFAIGLTQLYRTFEALKIDRCLDDCQDTFFRSLWDSMWTLLWSIFNALGTEDLQLAPNLYFTESVGVFMYAAYMVIAVIVLVNALIAMMSNTYSRVECNSDVEWKAARTILMAEYMSDTAASVPPPFNIVPTSRCIMRCFRRPMPSNKRAKSFANGRGVSKEDYSTAISAVVARHVKKVRNEYANDRKDDWVHEELETLKEGVANMRRNQQETQIELTKLQMDIQTNLQQIMLHLRSQKEAF